MFVLSRSSIVEREHPNLRPYPNIGRLYVIYLIKPDLSGYYFYACEAAIACSPEERAATASSIVLRRSVRGNTR